MVATPDAALTTTCRSRKRRWATVIAPVAASAAERMRTRCGAEATAAVASIAADRERML